MHLNDEKVQIIVIKDVSKAFETQMETMQKDFANMLAATLSHEQMTPMNVIINYSEELLIKLENVLAEHNLPVLFTRRSSQAKIRISPHKRSSSVMLLPLVYG